MPERTCFFIGSRDAADTVRRPLEAAIERHIQNYGVTRFVVGHYGKFDAQAAAALRQAKKRHPQVTLLLLIPYHPSEQPVPPPRDFNGTYYPEGMEQVPKKLAILRANRYMVDHSDYLIAYLHGSGNSRDLVQYARQRELQGLIRGEELETEAGQPG